MKLSDFSYDLPHELIAQTPIENRSMSRLLVLDKETGEVEHKHFCDVIDYLECGDCLVLNDTRVLPARLYGEKEGSGGKMEFVLLRQMEDDCWEVMVRPGKKAKVGVRFVFGSGSLRAEIIEVLENGNRVAKFFYSGSFYEVLDEVGLMPLPPYITANLEDRERYQTVYSKVLGSAAAPTAGLHFTRELMAKIEKKGIKIAYCTLHVGIGTFRPVKVENVLEHKMHSEYFVLKQGDADIINNAKKVGKRVISVGTTSTRTLETIADENGFLKEMCGSTDIFIYPGYKFKVVDGLITNFHLPESTLLMLVATLATRENVMRAYEEAIKERYRFFSFGDAMIIINKKR